MTKPTPPAPTVLPWSHLVDHARFDVEGDDPLHASSDLSGDPFDLEEGDVVVNAKRDVRIVCMAYNARVLWLDPRTGRVTDEPLATWHDWSGGEVWFIRDDGQGWRFRSPFAGRMRYLNAPEPTEPAPPCSLGSCAVCGRSAPLVDSECPNCRH